VKSCSNVALALAVTIALAGIACGRAETPAARRARGIELLNKSGAAVTGAQTLTFKAHEQGERVRRSGDKVAVTLEHVVQVRRPDRIHVRVSGSYDLELFYDGKRITLMSPAEKVYGIVPASGSLDEVVHGVMDRFDLPFPLGDLVTYDNAHRLVNDKTQGGWVGEETVRGHRASKVAWQHPAAEWAVWIPEDGPALPVRLEILYKGRRGSPRRTFDIEDWRVGAALADDVFEAKVPADFEGIPVLQRASAVREEIERGRSTRPETASPEKEKR
jgi:hypothetical protein